MGASYTAEHENWPIFSTEIGKKLYILWLILENMNMGGGPTFRNMEISPLTEFGNIVYILADIRKQEYFRTRKF